MAVYIIAEAGVNHNGRLDLALRLCDVAKAAGVDAVKFQTWKSEKIVTQTASIATFQVVNTHSNEETQFDMLKKLELSYRQFFEIKEYCDKIGIDFLSTPDEEDSLDFLVSLHLPFLKIGSGEVNNIPYLKRIGQCRMPVILSTGMSWLSDVEIAYRTLLEAGANSVSLLHCTTNYPCPMSEVNLCAMQTMKNAFKCKIGYSDHTMGAEIPIAAVAMGAEIIEKHFTLSRKMEGPDHKASLEPAELKYMVDCIRNIELALGDGIKRPNKSEIEISKVVLKSIVAKRRIQEGEELSVDNLTVKRAEKGISASYWNLILGKRATKNYDVDEPIQIR